MYGIVQHRTYFFQLQIHIFQLDVLRLSDVDAAAKTIPKLTASLEVLIPNVGAGTGGFLAQCSTEHIQENFEINTVPLPSYHLGFSTT